jgi:hypothetical protein
MSLDGAYFRLSVGPSAEGSPVWRHSLGLALRREVGKVSGYVVVSDEPGETHRCLVGVVRAVRIGSTLAKESD